MLLSLTSVIFSMLLISACNENITMDVVINDKKLSQALDNLRIDNIKPGNNATKDDFIIVNFSTEAGSISRPAKAKACTNPDCLEGCTEPLDVLDNTAQIGGLTEGNSYYVCLAEDKAGQVWKASQRKILVDMTSPTDPASVRAAEDQVSDEGLLFVEFSESQDLGNFEYFVKLCSTSLCNKGCSNEVHASVNSVNIGGFDKEGIYFACVKSVDEAGNESRQAVSTGIYISQQGAVLPVSNTSAPLYTGEPWKICSDQAFVDSLGNEVRGTMDCPTSSLRPEDVKSGVKIGDITGTGQYSSNSLCGADGEGACIVDGNNFVALKKNELVPSNLKASVTLGGVSGTVIPAPQNCAYDGTSNCIVDGSLFVAASTAQLVASNIKNGVVIGGISGSALLENHLNCTSAGQSGCVSTAIFRTVDLSQAEAGGAAGLTGAGFNAAIAAAGTLEFWDASGARHTAAGDADLTAANIKSGATLFGVAGSVTPTPSNCAADGAASCVVDGSSYVAASKAAVTAGNIKNGVSLGGVTGGYPSASHPLAAATITPDLTALGPSNPVGSYEFFDSAGTRYSGSILDGSTITPNTSSQAFSAADSVYRAFVVAGDADLTASNIITGTNIFGVAGVASTETHSTCTGNLQTGCVTTASWQSADVSNLNSGSVKSGVSMAGVTGGYPSASHPLATDTVTADLTSLGPATSTGSYEFFDSAGTRYTGSIADGGTVTPGTATQAFSTAATVYRAFTVAGDADLAAANIKSGTDILGVTGTFSSAPANCNSANQTGCVTTSTYKSMDLSQAGAGGAAGLTGAGFNAAIAAAGTLEFWDASGARHTAAGDADLTAANIKSGPTLFGVAGSVTPSPADCAADGAGSCVVDGSSFIAASKAAVTAGNIKAGISLGGVTGGYPSASHPLAADTVTADLTSLGPATGTGSYEFFDSTGTRYTGSIADGGTVTPGTAAQTFSTASTVYRAFIVAGDADLTAAGVASGISIFGVAGSAAIESHANCTGNAQTGCVATATWQSADLANLAAGNIKNGVAIAGVTGGYPSASHPLAGASAAADLDSTTFDAKIKAATTFEYWTSDGTRQTGAGDADITATSIKSGVTIFSVTGSAAVSSPSCTGVATQGACEADSACTWTGAACQVNSWNIRAGVTIASTAGGLKVNCRNRADSTFFDSDTMPPGNTGTTGGSTLHWWDTIDDNNGGRGFPTELVSGWTSQTDCSKNEWEDLTSGGCSSDAKDCVMRDKITRLMWSESYPVTTTAAAVTGLDWQNAVEHCHNLVWSGYNDWRMPTQKELMEAWVHGIRNIAFSWGTARPGGDLKDNNSYFISDEAIKLWSATSTASGTTAYYLLLDTGRTIPTVKSPSYGQNTVICVR